MSPRNILESSFRAMALRVLKSTQPATLQSFYEAGWGAKCTAKCFKSALKAFLHLPEPADKPAGLYQQSSVVAQPCQC